MSIFTQDIISRLKSEPGEMGRRLKNEPGNQAQKRARRRLKNEPGNLFSDDAPKPLGAVVQLPDGRWRWKPLGAARRAGELSPRGLGRDEPEARRRAALIEGEVAGRIAAEGLILHPGWSGPSPPHPAEWGAAVASADASGAWSVRRGGEVLLAGARRFEALALLRELGGVVEIES